MRWVFYELVDVSVVDREAGDDEARGVWKEDCGGLLLWHWV